MGREEKKEKLVWECIRPETHSRGFLFFFSHSKEGKKFEKAKTHTKTQGKTKLAYY